MGIGKEQVIFSQFNQPGFRLFAYFKVLYFAAKIYCVTMQSNKGFLLVRNEKCCSKTKRMKVQLDVRASMCEVKRNNTKPFPCDSS